MYKENKSIHLTEIKELDYNFEEEIKNGDFLINIISESRGKKSEANMSLKTPIKKITIECSEDINNAINESIKDFKATLFIEELELKHLEKEYQITTIELESID